MTNEFSALITDNCAYLKACVLYFLYFTKRKHFKNCKKTLCILSKKVFTFSIYSIFCNFFPSFPQFPDSKSQMKLEEL